MALFALEEAGRLDYGEAINKGLRWISDITSSLATCGKRRSRLEVHLSWEEAQSVFGQNSELPWLGW